jgi:hypothetical protein
MLVDVEAKRAAEFRAPARRVISIPYSRRVCATLALHQCEQRFAQTKTDLPERRDANSGEDPSSMRTKALVAIRLFRF